MISPRRKAKIYCSVAKLAVQLCRDKNAKVPDLATSNMRHDIIRDVLLALRELFRLEYGMGRNNVLMNPYETED
jgi:hypothetical protein